ncbi:UNVERIFIED_CONTAM: hypothetical protein NCL1_13475 [Trichonephila clavipes]
MRRRRKAKSLEDFAICIVNPEQHNEMLATDRNSKSRSKHKNLRNLNIVIHETNVLNRYDSYPIVNTVLNYFL